MNDVIFIEGDSKQKQLEAAKGHSFTWLERGTPKR